jgi:MoaA/NifB/PqqE/SkfB family radical SAM enzyme
MIDEVKTFKPLISVISTEPLLYKDLFKFAKYVRQSGLDIAITTNGILLKKFAKDFVESEVNNIWVSIDGPVRTHNYIRGIPQIFQKAKAGILEIEKYKKELGKENPKLNINFTISNFNYDKIDAFMKDIIDLKPKTVTISHYNYVTKEMAEEHNFKYGDIVKTTTSCVSAVNLKEIKPAVLLKELNKVKKNYQAKTNLGFSPDLTTEKQIFDFYNNPHIVIAQKACRAPWTIAQILANGDLTISTRCFNMSLGNINKTTFEEAWNSAEFRKFRKIMKKQGMFVPACTRCCAVL